MCWNDFNGSSLPPGKRYEISLTVLLILQEYWHYFTLTVLDKK